MRGKKVKTVRNYRSSSLLVYWRRPMRGQALVEFALILPVFLGLFFGLIEVGLIAGASALYESAVQQALRLETLAGTNDNTIDQETVAGILNVVKPLFVAHVVRIEIYQSDASGRGPQLSSENIFDDSGAPTGTQNWPVASRGATNTAPVYLGIQITYSYTWLTSFVGAVGVPLTLHAGGIAPEPLQGG
jgi:Flp pilus assembly protein TadG